ncbi:MAG: ribosome-associated translation inhibitor RaiA [Clostridia bacterium]|nr:ribosome-associated translation inhibitor RaiA [Clostridia bacterium]
MRVNITSKGFTAKQSQVELIEKKFGKLEKFFEEDTVVNVTMGYNKKKLQTMEAMIPVKGMIFRAEFSDLDMNTCLDKVVEKLTTQITRYKKKIQKSHRHVKGIIFEEVPETADSLSEDSVLEPIKTKSFDLTPMTAEEAVLQMEMLEHSFYVFLNEDTGKVAVVYKRTDDSYGMLDPKY